MARDKTNKTPAATLATTATRRQTLGDEAPEARFVRLQAEEAKSFKRAASQSENAGPAQRENLSREWFAASSRLIKEYIQVQSRDSGGIASPTLPWEALLRLAKLAEALSIGRLPQPVQDVTASGGRPGRWTGERRDIAVALDYIDYAKTGRVRDKAFIARVADAFKVDRTTVRDWQNAANDIHEGFSPLPVERFPKALEKAGARYHFNRTGEKTDG